MSHPANPTRRQFLKKSAAGAGLLILPSGIVSGQNAPNSKLNLALIGTAGRAKAHFNHAQRENVVALCDVDSQHLGSAANTFKGCRHYADWRELLDKENDLDGIICSTTDHTHAHISTWAMRRGLHVYCEKPLANTVGEARIARATYLKNKGTLATQIGTQRHANANFAAVRKAIRDGVVGDLQKVSAWGNRKLRRPAYHPAKGQPPENLSYDLWIGPSPFHPYNPEYFNDKNPGSNCLNWNMFWDFGSGQIGDMGSHTMDLAYNAIDADLPTSVMATGEKFNPDVVPVEFESHCQIPANDWRGEITLSWYMGGAMPKPPTDTAFRGIGHGALFTGTKGYLLADFGSHVFIPKGSAPDARFSRSGVKGGFDFQGEWINACKGGPEPSCNFDYAGRLIETMLLGLVAYRAGKELKYDGATGLTDDAEANKYLSKKYREGWPLEG